MAFASPPRRVAAGASAGAATNALAELLLKYKLTPCGVCGCNRHIDEFVGRICWCKVCQDSLKRCNYARREVLKTTADSPVPKSREMNEALLSNDLKRMRDDFVELDGIADEYCATNALADAKM